MWCVLAANVPDEEKELKLRSSADSMLETNGTALLQIGNFKGSENLNKKRLSRRSVRAESSSKSEENVDDKVEKGDHGTQNRQSDLSDDADSSDSDGNRGISTKGLIPEDFEPESNPNIHERYSKDSGSE
ncbi:unnamed protein product [Euphydryas editha]|uniref:Uncharacterized protein n=1 Tax=Euphydryas editha TaxID=104508 RepID=A0AAU9TET6_EUPED|nr:unnamed protein product [Euphydryas editha]